MQNTAPASPLTIVPAHTSAGLDSIKSLFLEYEKFLGVDLCFQNFEQEMASLPGKYAPPKGGLFTALYHGKAVGCAAFRPLEPGICELKRLYVQPAYTGHGIGHALLSRIMQEAKQAGYHTLRCDSLRRLTAAAKLYRDSGFKEIAPYNENPFEDVYYMECAL